VKRPLLVDYFYGKGCVICLIKGFFDLIKLASSLKNEYKPNVYWKMYDSLISAVEIKSEIIIIVLDVREKPFEFIF